MNDMVASVKRMKEYSSQLIDLAQKIFAECPTCQGAPSPTCKACSMVMVSTSQYAMSVAFLERELDVVRLTE